MPSEPHQQRSTSERILELEDSSKVLKKEVGRLTAVHNAEFAALGRMREEVDRLTEEVRRLMSERDTRPGPGGPGGVGGETLIAVEETSVVLRRGEEDEEWKWLGDEKPALDIKEGGDWEENGPGHRSLPTMAGEVAPNGTEDPGGMVQFDSATSEGEDEERGRDVRGRVSFWNAWSSPTQRARRDVRRLLFADSIYSRLFMDEIDLGEFGSYTLLKRDRISAVWIMAFQLVTYIYLALLMFNKIKASLQNLENPSLEIISSDYCYNASRYDGDFYDAMMKVDLYDNLATANVTAESLPGLLQCSNQLESIAHTTEEALLNKIGGWMAILLLLQLIAPDVVGAFVLLTCPGRRCKAVAVIILVEAVAAICVATLSLSLFEEDGALDRFMWIVGIAFVHDLDEKFAIMQNTMLALYQVKGRRPFELLVMLFCVIF
eukprot:CAMPEP_0181079310 /NCGR_PEP_ID=MMETSP1071-20121207/1962_1 /TAXON_ID=35127 /ORGANISM="Thalassiosira sp., Strain NH16" /LENGTH=433 /DNA_ID=CAMNT_0023160705 /DNA_START=46 /DNA_END=1344 /DNA_ORIENTATION=+